MPKAASHRRIAFSSIASNTGARSPGELLMTPNTSAVAVCWSSASVSSAVRVLDLLFEVGVGFLQVRRHAVELAGKALQLVAGVDVDAAVELAGADPRGAGLQLADRHGHPAGEKQCGQCRQTRATTSSAAVRNAEP